MIRHHIIDEVSASMAGLRVANPLRIRQSSVRLVTTLLGYVIYLGATSSFKRWKMPRLTKEGFCVRLMDVVSSSRRFWVLPVWMSETFYTLAMVNMWRGGRIVYFASSFSLQFYTSVRIEVYFSGGEARISSAISWRQRLEKPGSLGIW